MLKMKKLSKISLLICLCLATFPSFAGANRQVAGTVTFMMGDVFISHDKTTWVNADFDMKIHQRDQIRTGAESRCEITLEDGSIVRMEENSLQCFEKVETTSSSRKSSIFLSAGKIWVNARKIVSKNDSFQVRTDKAVCAIRGTQFRVDTGSNHTRISAYGGEVATWSALFDRADKDAAISKPYPVAGPDPVSMEKWVEIVKAFQQITIDAKGGYEKQDLDIESLSEDAWTIWNMTRDSSTSIHP
ncbi:MAG: FecR family protein [Proteobacteria bacterium]|nr:FecR domain-containing protein [Desulfobacteraceae bacterium]MBU4013398.1 FecR family protein [Pseudomonadota bacterium]MBU4066747.1 FecR family protein [Pseudomonadota bacterium]MBU4100629.1 FecR family protein [Pseudomonadota bacterium]MBU4128072.1 FecR family protein [Pseudomonadota bacterium]